MKKIMIENADVILGNFDTTVEAVQDERVGECNLMGLVIPRRKRAMIAKNDAKLTNTEVSQAFKR